MEYIDTTCKSFSSLSEIKDVNLTFYTSVASLSMAFDADKIGKIIMNLLSNAFKFTPNGGRVDVSLCIIKENNLEEFLQIKVTDTGSGINEEDKKHIFERFYQADNKSGDRKSTRLNSSHRS